MNRITSSKAHVAVSLALAASIAMLACKRQHYGVATATMLPYPTCPSGSAAPTTVFSTDLQSGPNDTRGMPIVEHFRLEKRGCYYAAITRQEWPMQTSDVEALYDEELRPIRVWRRNTLPVSKRPDGNADIKLFELRTTPIGVKHRGDDGKIDFEELRAPAKPEVLVGPGRGIVSVWLRKAHLAPGEKTHAIGFDFRGVEKVERMALERLPDRRLDLLGRTARVYTFFGKETVFANDDDVVIGDLAGLVPLGPNAPPPVPTFAPIDPVHTP